MLRNQTTQTFIAAALLLCGSGTALAGQGAYLGGSLGIAGLQDAQVRDARLAGVTSTASFDNGTAANLAAGYDFDGPRLELEWSYRKNNLSRVSSPALGSAASSGKAESQALLLNGYYDFHNKSAITPFVMAGVGYAKVKIANLNFPAPVPFSSSYNDSVTAWQFGAGVGSAISERVTLELSWRYFRTSSPKSGTSTAEYRGHSLLAGVRYAF